MAALYGGFLAGQRSLQSIAGRLMRIARWRRSPGKRAGRYHDEIILEPREGIEPPITDYKSVVIPFNYRGEVAILPLRGD